MRLYVLAHTDKAEAYAQYAGHYLQTDGQVYWSDEHQFSPYLPEAGQLLARNLGWRTFASLMISELYVPRERFEGFMSSARRAVLETGANLVYGTVRLIEAEEGTTLGGRRGTTPASYSTCWLSTRPKALTEPGLSFRR